MKISDYYSQPKNGKMKESDLAEIVIDWLEKQHWDVYQEVPVIGGVADILAVRNNLVWIIETKTSMSFSVMNQAYHRTAHYRSIAVPSSPTRDRNFQERIAKLYLGIGILTIDKRKNINESVQPKLMREYHNQAKNIIKKLIPEYKTYAKAGTNSGSYYTPYKQTIDSIKFFLSRHPNSTLKEIIAFLTGSNGHRHHYSSVNSAKTCLRKALENWESDWCNVEKNGKEIIYSIKESNTP